MDLKKGLKKLENDQDNQANDTGAVCHGLDSAINRIPHLGEAVGVRYD